MSYDHGTVGNAANYNSPNCEIRIKYGQIAERIHEHMFPRPAGKKQAPINASLGM
jgi:hypothetical protein